MPTHSETALLPYSPRQMFDLVADVEKYPQFLPWVGAARIWDRGRSGFMAELMVSYLLIRESYTSKVSLHPPSAAGEAAIEVEMVKGPFHHLVNKWKFLPHAEGCEIEFFIDFAFSSPLLQRMLGGVFDRASHKMLEAFKNRADSLYGRGTPGN